MLSWEYPPHTVGGLGKHVAELVPGLTRRGIAISLITPLLRSGAEREMINPSTHIFRVVPPMMDEYDFLTFALETNQTLERATQRLIDEFGHFDLIHNHDWLTAPTAIALKHQLKIPLITTIHATEHGRNQGYLHSRQSRQIHEIEQSLMHEAWRVIVCSAFMKNQLAMHFYTPPDRVDVTPNGVHIQPGPFYSSEERYAFRRRFADPHDHIALYVGRIVYEKGLHTLVDAWPQILKHVRARLVIAGAGAQLNELKAHIKALGLKEWITFTGFIPDEDRDRLYRVADVAVFPSLYEPFGIVALEAFAAECPVVASNTGGLTEVIRPHETGIAVEPGNVDSLVWGILHTLQNPEWSRARATNALHEVSAHYIWDRVARETLSVYNRVYQEWLASGWGKEIVMRTETHP